MNFTSLSGTPFLLFLSLRCLMLVESTAATGATTPEATQLPLSRIVNLAREDFWQTALGSATGQTGPRLQRSTGPRSVFSGGSTCAKHSLRSGAGAERKCV